MTIGSIKNPTRSTQTPPLKHLSSPTQLSTSSLQSSPSQPSGHSHTNASTCKRNWTNFIENHDPPCPCTCLHFDRDEANSRRCPLHTFFHRSQAGTGKRSLVGSPSMWLHCDTDWCCKNQTLLISHCSENPKMILELTYKGILRFPSPILQLDINFSNT